MCVCVCVCVCVLGGGGGALPVNLLIYTLYFAYHMTPIFFYTNDDAYIRYAIYCQFPFNSYISSAVVYVGK